MHCYYSEVRIYTIHISDIYWQIYEFALVAYVLQVSRA